ncbi:RNA polymerase II degradation factor 1-like [Spinacia oleracea]|uniref:RNA polymerase II degradation factor 1-like n=1 Tax=Spinacia oleracea TaxID=3562 RepID=A0ABM3QYS1_SPIOL|nr:RNA polymerase II degradation factor 1-like [Spinacia oleracea]
MSAVWLLLHYKSHDFDVRVVDTDKCQLVDIFIDIFEESTKQNVVLPEKFRLYTTSPTGRVELVDDSVMLRMWGWNMGTDTIELWVEESDSPGVAFRSAVALLERQRKEDERKMRERQEEVLRMPKEAEEQRRAEEEKERVRKEMEEQMRFTVAMEVPVVDVENDGVEYVRIITSDDADEVFPGLSQPEPQTQESPSAKKPTKTKPKKKLTPKKRKQKPAPPQPTESTPTTQTRQTETDPQSPQPTQPETTQPTQEAPQPTQPETAPPPLC